MRFGDNGPYQRVHALNVATHVLRSRGEIMGPPFIPSFPDRTASMVLEVQCRHQPRFCIKEIKKRHCVASLMQHGCVDPMELLTGETVIRL